AVETRRPCRLRPRWIRRGSGAASGRAAPTAVPGWTVISAAKLAVIERHRRRVWGLCYRMTGDSVAADDLTQESLARAIERSAMCSIDRRRRPRLRWA